MIPQQSRRAGSIADCVADRAREARDLDDEPWPIPVCWEKPVPGVRRRLPFGRPMVIVAAFALIALAAILAGCGGSDKPPPADGPNAYQAVLDSYDARDRAWLRK